MGTDSISATCPACGAGVRDVETGANDVSKIIFDCGNVGIHQMGSMGYTAHCGNAYFAAVKYHKALEFYASAMASDIAYDGGAKARVALLPVV